MRSLIVARPWWLMVHSALLISGIAAVAAGTIAMMTDKGSGSETLRGSAGVR